MKNTMVYRLLLVLILVLLYRQPTVAQLVVSGQGSGSYVQSGHSPSRYTINEGRGTFGWRLDLFGDAIISDNVFFYSNLRMTEDQEVHIDLLRLRITDVAKLGLTVDLGKIFLPFGSLGERRYPKQNPFYHLPLMNEHITTLAQSDYRLHTLDPDQSIAGDGFRILDYGLYDAGISMNGALGDVGYSVALINGAVCATSSYSSTGFNNNHGFGTVARLSYFFSEALTVGSSFGYGPFISSSNSGGEDPHHYPQRISGLDVSYSVGHISIIADLVYNNWMFDDEPDLNAFLYNIETTYSVTPRILCAFRIGGIRFNEITTSVYTQDATYEIYSGTWDDNVVRYEAAVHYRIEKNALLKCIYEINSTFGNFGDPSDNLFVAQIVMSFE